MDKIEQRIKDKLQADFDYARKSREEHDEFINNFINARLRYIVPFCEDILNKKMIMHNWKIDFVDK